MDAAKGGSEGHLVRFQQQIVVWLKVKEQHVFFSLNQKPLWLFVLAEYSSRFFLVPLPLKRQIKR